MTRRQFVPFFLFLVLGEPAWADGPADNLADKVRRIPPPGIAVPDEVRAELEAGVALLGKEIDSLRSALAQKPALLGLLPDVQIFHNAVRYALQHDEFYDAREFTTAKKQLQAGLERARQLREGKTPWTTATGLVVRGYKSKIDDSIQPFGLVVPASFQPNIPNKYRLDFWCHGRGEKLTELSFLQGRMTSPGEFTPPNAFVLHLYGRYCCANKFAGEVDLFEAYDSVRRHYPIDENRLVIRGFSMGGAACWQFAVHYPGMFAAAAPGAGFSETPEFLRVFQNEVVQPAAYEKKLWNLYDCPGYAVNLFNLPTVAYSGEIDKQKQAADVMERALAAEGITLAHLIGPKTGHSYQPQAKAELNRRIDAIAGRGRNSVPRQVKFATFTLRYNSAFWLMLDGLEEHWSQARVDAKIASNTTVRIATRNVSAFTLKFSPGQCPLDITQRPIVVIDGAKVEAAPALSDRSWLAHFRKVASGWTASRAENDGLVRKRHGLQGPIDDAFLDRFIMVAPTGQPLSEKLGAWTTGEMAHAVEHWRRQFRGEAIVKKDVEITDADIASGNLVLWGDPRSNVLLAKIVEKLPIGWNSKEIDVAGAKYAADRHVPVMIYPNPLNPKKYVVLNSGFTFREYDYLNNARQVPKLPDYAIIDISQPVTGQKPGGIATAGFFDEEWRIKK